jgi:hypothetical protein
MRSLPREGNDVRRTWPNHSIENRTFSNRVLKGQTALWSHPCRTHRGGSPVRGNRRRGPGSSRGRALPSGDSPGRPGAVPFAWDSGREFDGHQRSGDLRRRSNRRRRGPGPEGLPDRSVGHAAMGVPSQHRLVLRPGRSPHPACHDRWAGSVLGHDDRPPGPVPDGQRSAAGPSHLPGVHAEENLPRHRYPDPGALQAGEHPEDGDRSEGGPSGVRLRRGGGVQPGGGCPDRPSRTVE